MSEVMRAATVRPAAPDQELMRVAICGSVDSGKSTLLGRLVFDAGLVPDDEHPESGPLDLALLADGLEAEAEQGITIDVAYRHFFTQRRSYLFADAPGHLQYTRNMATAAADAEVAIIVVDATVGITEQTQRHLAICAVMGVPNVIVAVNKLDAVDDAHEGFSAITYDMIRHAGRVRAPLPVFVPISAIDGENVTVRSTEMPWYSGASLVEALDAVELDAADAESALRLPVQSILRGEDGSRWIAGTIAAGGIAVGDAIGIAGRPARVADATIDEIATPRGDVRSAHAGAAVRIRLIGHVDVSRGDMLCAPADAEDGLARAATVRLVWLQDAPLRVGDRYVVRAGTRWTYAQVTAVQSVLDPAKLKEREGDEVTANAIATATVEFAQAIPLNAVGELRATGRFLLVDPTTNDTAAACIVETVTRASRASLREDATITRADRARQLGHGGVVVWFTGLSGAGKSTIAHQVEAALHTRGRRVFALHGDNLRHGLCGDLGFSPEDRTENLRRAAEVARLMLDAGLIVLCEFISPMEIDRREARRIVGADDFVEIHVHASVDECIARDPKGLYRRALAGELRDFTGVDSPYEAPAAPDLRLDTGTLDVAACVDQVLALIDARVEG
ncbi:MAG: adenylyl-sulfate kinase [Gaiellales bacterium]